MRFMKIYGTVSKKDTKMFAGFAESPTFALAFRKER